MAKRRHGKMCAMEDLMNRSNFQKLVGAMSVAGFIALIQILDRTEPLPISLRLAVWLFAVSIPIHAVCFARDGAWFKRVFFATGQRWPTVLLLASILVFLVGLTCLFFYVDPIYGGIFLVVSLFGMSRILDKNFPGPSDGGNA